MKVDNNTKLTDSFLLKNCQLLNTATLPTFISIETQESLKKLFKCIGTESNIAADDFDNFDSLWKDLLSDAISFLKLKDRREYKDIETDRSRDKIAYGVNELHSYYKEYRDFEALLYGADRFYRDHTTHVFRVWFIGNWLIEKFETISWDYEKLLKKDGDLEISKDEVMAIWCIIALCHDLGYPLDKVKRIKGKINSMMGYFGGASDGENGFQIPSHHHFINDFILKFIASKLIRTPGDLDGKGFQYKTSVQSKYYLKFSKSFENFNHGIITCILLMKNLIYFLESDMDLVQPFSITEDARQFYIRREILRAIAGHTCTDIYHVYPNSLSFILILADELQVWERPTFNEMKIGRTRLFISTTVEEITISKISIRMDIDDEKPIDGENSGEIYFNKLCAKWMKWLRGALDAGKRSFEFSIKGRIHEKGAFLKELRFNNEPLNKFSYYSNDKEDIDFWRKFH